MSLDIRTAVVKGKKEDINRILNEYSLVDVEEVEKFENGLVVYRVDLGDINCKDDCSDLFLTKHSEIKFLALAYNQKEYGDKEIFKDFGKTEIETRKAFEPYWFSTYMEEYEGNEIPFLDNPIEFELESYSDGE